MIRPAVAEDVPSIAEVERLCFAQPWPESSYAQELARVGSHVDVCFAQGQPVGFSCTWHVAGEAHLLRIAVLPTARGRGFGRALVDVLVARARADHCCWVDLEVGRANGAATALYLRTGFVQVGERPGYYQHPPDDALLYRLVLRP